MIKTEFFDDFISYYKKAAHLEWINLDLRHDGHSINDPLMSNVSIYDTIHRRQAGFSKALEDIHGVRQRKDLVKYQDFTNRLSDHQFQYLHLFHRFTGSGASFQPTILPDGTRNPKEHGYYNNHVEQLALQMEHSWKSTVDYIVNNTKPMVTSVGNQPPSLKNPDPTKYRLAQQYYFDQIARKFITDYLMFLTVRRYTKEFKTRIKEAVDFCCEWHKERGFKQWHFVLTAFVMDTAEYYPELVYQKSHCYYGANCVKSFDLMFTKEKSDPKSKAEFQELCMTELCKTIHGNPYDVEDVCCDYIRYIKEYIPKGYENLRLEQRVNNSTLKVDGKYPLEIQQRITEVLGE